MGTWSEFSEALHGCEGGGACQRCLRERAVWFIESVEVRTEQTYSMSVTNLAFTGCVPPSRWRRGSRSWRDHRPGGQAITALERTTEATSPSARTACMQPPYRIV